MKLIFKPHRLTAIKRLRGLTIADIDRKMQDIAGGKRSFNMDRWETGNCLPNSFDKVKLLATATEVPIGFYYYNRVDITLIENWVNIFIPDTNEQVRFPFIEVTGASAGNGA